MRGLLTSLFLICTLLSNGVATFARDNKAPKQQKSRVERKASKTSEPNREAREKRESRRELAKRRELIKRNPRLAYLFKGEEDEDVLRTDQPREAIEWYLQKRLPKGEKQLPIERYFKAKDKIKKMKRFSSARNKNLPSATETNGDVDEVFNGEDGEFPNGTGGGGAGDGSSSTSGALGTWQSIGPGNVGGRTRALLIDPINPDVMYAAAVAGGIWKTTNGGNAWTPLNDFLANIAVTCMAFDPSNSSTIYAGTGEGFFNADGVRGAGIFKSTDAGATWTRLPATASSADFFFVNDIVVSPSDGQHVYAATRSGVLRSLDGGSTWTTVLV
ncbi:MAG TPA: hypothetical protein VJT69_09830, partial [Pyrinomonadaceae bacterium]|nr:hypothetical protein [Pyrinomonadaceae bacterium]